MGVMVIKLPLDVVAHKRRARNQLDFRADDPKRSAQMLYKILSLDIHVPSNRSSVHEQSSQCLVMPT